MISEGKPSLRQHFSSVLQERGKAVIQTLREQHSRQKKKKSKCKDPEETGSGACSGVIDRKGDQRNDTGSDRVLWYLLGYYKDFNFYLE